MAVIAESIDLPAPPSEVWAKIADLEQWPEWLTIHTGFPDGTPAAQRGHAVQAEGQDHGHAG